MYVGLTNPNQIIYTEISSYAGKFYTWEHWCDNSRQPWAGTNTYGRNSFCVYDNKTYISLKDNNKNKRPDQNKLPAANAYWLEINETPITANYSNYFGSDFHFLSSNVDSWKSISGNIIPFVRTSTAYPNNYLDHYLDINENTKNLCLTVCPNGVNKVYDFVSSWNPTGYSIYGISDDTPGGLSAVKHYRSYNCIGSATLTIDLTNKTEKYIHIAFPTTLTLNESIYDNTSARVFITDLKMSYEAIN